MPGPIRPSEVASHKTAVIPEKVFEVFNELITKAWDGQTAIVKQKVAEVRIAEALNVSCQAVLDEGFLNVEPAYREAGWKVEYDKPGFNETYEPTYKFRK